MRDRRKGASGPQGTKTVKPSRATIIMPQNEYAHAPHATGDTMAVAKIQVPKLSKNPNRRITISSMLAALAGLFAVVLSSQCSLYNGVTQNDDKYVRGASARDRIRRSLVFPAFYDFRDSTSAALTTADRAYFQQQYLLDIVLADMVVIDDSAYYREKDVSDCVGQISRSALYLDSMLGLFVCNLKPVSQI